MARIAGINIPQNKLVHIGLTYIYGIGNKFSNQICTSLEIPRAKRINELTDDEILKIREYIDANFKVEGDLRRDYSLTIKRLIDLACYRGTRHRKKLPVRGQRTRCNARTRKGKAIAIARKKLTPNKKKLWLKMIKLKIKIRRLRSLQKKVKKILTQKRKKLKRIF